MVTTPEKLAQRRTRGELANLDLLRAVAVGLVFMCHLLATMRVRAMSNLGHFGVLLFFVHTALVLMMSMERLGLSGRNLYTAFMVRRFFRIYPLSILSVLIVVCLRIPPYSWQGAYRWEGWTTFISNLMLTQNLTQSLSLNSVLWSLPFEIQMYAILPVLFLWALRFPRLRAMAGAWLIAVGIAVAEQIARPGISGQTFFLIAPYFPCFCAGVFAWRLMKIRTPKLPGWGWVFFLVALVLGYRLVELLWSFGPAFGPAVLDAMHGRLRNHRIWYIPPDYLCFVNDWVFCAAVGLTVPYFLEIRSRWLKWISKQIARYSYGIYVSHVPILWLCFVRLRVGSVVMSTALTVFLTALVSVLAYHCLEDPAIRVGKRVAARMVQRRA